MNEDIPEGYSIHFSPSVISGVYAEFNVYLLDDKSLSNEMDIVVDIFNSTHEVGWDSEH